jgi:hypothetical protein
MHVHIQPPPCFALVVADIAGVRALLCVDVGVLLQRREQLKALPARAHMLVLVIRQVYRQIEHASEATVALEAGVHGIMGCASLARPLTFEELRSCN